MTLWPHDSAVILIVDSDPLVRTGAAAVLNMSGYECHCAGESEAAFKAVKALELDLIISEIDLGDQCGLELCQQLRQDPRAADTPVIFVSHRQAPDIVRRSHDAGGFYYLRKPFDPEVLVELVAKALWLPHLVNTRISQARGISAAHFPATPARRSRSSLDVDTTTAR